MFSKWKLTFTQDISRRGKASEMLLSYFTLYNRAQNSKRRKTTKTGTLRRNVYNRELKQPQRQRQQDRLKFAYLTMKNSSFAPFARAFLHILQSFSFF